MWVGQAEFICFLGELSWGSGFIYIFPDPPILNISNGENGSMHWPRTNFNPSIHLASRRMTGSPSCEYLCAIEPTGA